MAVTDEEMVIRADLELNVKKAEEDVKALKRELSNALKSNNAILASGGKPSADSLAWVSSLKSDLKSAQRSLASAKNEIKTFGEIGAESFGVTEKAVSRLSKAMVGLLSAKKLGEFAKRVVSTRGEFQQLEVAFETMLGSKEKADKMMAEAVDLAAKTPFDLQGVAAGAKSLLAYGMQSEDVIETLRRLGDVAAGLSIPLGRLTSIYGQALVKGKLQTRDLIRYQAAGIPILDELAKMYGKTTNEVRNMVSAGKVGFTDVKRVFEQMTNEGGKFANLMEKQSKTVTGQISNIQDAIDEMFNEIGKKTEGPINAVLGLTSNLVENYEKVGKVVIPLVATFGALNAAKMLQVAIFKKSIAAVATDTVVLGKNTKEQLKHIAATEGSAAAQKALNKAIMSNPYVLLGSAIAMATVGLIAYARAHNPVLQAEKKIADAQGELATEMNKERETLANLNAELNNAEKGSDRWNKARGKAISLYSKYKSDLADEIDKTGTLASSYDDLAKSIENARKKKLFDDASGILNNEFDSAMSKTNADIYKRIKSKNGSDFNTIAMEYSAITSWLSTARQGDEIPENIKSIISKYNTTQYGATAPTTTNALSNLINQYISLSTNKSTLVGQLEEWGGEGATKSEAEKMFSGMTNESIDSFMEDMRKAKQDAIEKATKNTVSQTVQGQTFGKDGEFMFDTIRQTDKEYEKEVEKTQDEIEKAIKKLQIKWRDLINWNPANEFVQKQKDASIEKFKEERDAFVDKYGDMVGYLVEDINSLSGNEEKGSMKFSNILERLSGAISHQYKILKPKKEPRLRLLRRNDEGNYVEVEGGEAQYGAVAKEQKGANDAASQKAADAANEAAIEAAATARAADKKITSAKKTASEAKLNAERQIVQNEINQMNNGLAKEMKQADFNHRKQLEQIEKQKEEYIEKLKAVEKAKWMKANEGKKESYWDENLFYQSQTWKDNEAFVTATYGDAKNGVKGTLESQENQSYSKTLDDILGKYRKEYGTFAEKQAEIRIEYGDKIMALMEARILARTRKEKDAITAEIEAMSASADGAIAKSEYEYAQKYSSPEKQREAFIKTQQAERRTFLANNPNEEDIQFFDAKQDYELSKYDYEQIVNYGAFDEVLAALRDKWEKFILTLPEEQREAARKSMGNEVSDFLAGSAERNGNLASVFIDPAKQTKAMLKENIRLAREYVETAKLKPEDAKAIEDAISGMQNEIDNMDLEGWDSGYKSVITSAKKYSRTLEHINDLTAKGAASDSQEVKEATGEMLRAKAEMKKSIAATGLDVFVSGLQKSVNLMQQLADITGDVSLKDAADQLGSFTQNLSAGLEGLKSGGWIGAIVGGVTDAVNQTIDAITKAKVAQAELAKEQEEFNRRLTMNSLKVNNSDYSNAFGTDSLKKAQDAYKKAGEALKLYNDTVDKEATRTADKHKKMNWATVAFLAPLSGTWIYNAKRVTQYTNEYLQQMDAIKKGYNALQAMSINVTQYSGWAKFWGAEDEFVSLKDYAPELWNEEGDFLVDKAKEFLHVNTFLSEEQKQQIQNVIDLKEAYDDLKETIDEYVSSLTGNITGDLSEKMLDNFIKTGSALVDMDDYLSDFNRNMAKSVIQSLLLQEVFTDTMKESLGNMILSGNTTGAIELYNQLLQQANDMVPEIEQFLSGIDLGSASRSGSESGFNAMSQDTGNELNGRFAAIQEHTYGIRDTVNVIKAQNTDLLSRTGQLLIEVQGIHDDTTDIREDMKEVKSAVAGMQSGVAKIVDNGVRMLS